MDLRLALRLRDGVLQCDIFALLDSLYSYSYSQLKLFKNFVSHACMLIQVLYSRYKTKYMQYTYGHIYKQGSHRCHVTSYI